MSAPEKAPAAPTETAAVSPTDPSPTTNMDGQYTEMPVWRRDLLRRRKSQAKLQGTGVATMPGRNRFARRKQEVTLVKTSPAPGEPAASTSIAGAGPPLASAQIPAAKNTSATPSLTGPATATKRVPPAEPDTAVQVVPTLALATAAAAAAGPARVSVPANRFRSRGNRSPRKATTITDLQAVAAVPSVAPLEEKIDPAKAPVWYQVAQVRLKTLSFCPTVYRALNEACDTNERNC